MMRVDKKEVKMKFQIMPRRVQVHYAQICLTKPGAKDILCVGVK